MATKYAVMPTNAPGGYYLNDRVVDTEAEAHRLAERHGGVAMHADPIDGMPNFYNVRPIVHNIVPVLGRTNWAAVLYKGGHQMWAGPAHAATAKVAVFDAYDAARAAAEDRGLTGAAAHEAAALSSEYQAARAAYDRVNPPA